MATLLLSCRPSLPPSAAAPVKPKIMGGSSNSRNEATVAGFIQNVLSNLDLNSASMALRSYVSPTLEYRVDGRIELDYDQFLAHLQSQRTVLESMTMRPESVQSAGDLVTVACRVNLKRRNGNSAEARTVLVVKCDGEGRIARVDEAHEWLSGEGL